MRARDLTWAGLLLVTVCGCRSAADIALGTLDILVSIRATNNAAVDTIGVDIVVDSQAPHHANAVLDSLVLKVAEGQHTVLLLNLKPNCTLDLPNPQTATVRRDSTTQVLLTGSCQ